MKRRDVIFGAAMVMTGNAFAQEVSDYSAPKTPGETGLTGPLHTVTIISPDLAALEKMYVDGLGLTLTGPVNIDDATRKTLAATWGMPPDLKWQMYLFRRPSVPLAIQIRVLVTETPTPAIRKTWSRQEVGPYGMGFPNTDVESWDKHISALGFNRATSEVERFPLKRPDGKPYDVLEATFDGPEYLRAIAISRTDGMPQVGDVDLTTGRGGPGYATQVVVDMDGMAKFFTTVLDYEVRTDRLWRAYEVPFRFITAYAKGAKNGHVALAAYDAKDVIPGTGVAPAPPHRGMAMWSFPVTSLDKIKERITAAGLTPVGTHGRVVTDDLGPRRAITVKAPNGFLIEVYEAVS